MIATERSNIGLLKAFGYGDMAQPTVDGLLTRAYSGLLAGLSPQMQMNLHLDLANDQMTFDFPTGVNNAYFGAGNLSTTSWPVFSVTSVPEPAALALVEALHQRPAPPLKPGPALGNRFQEGGRRQHR